MIRERPVLTARWTELLLLNFRVPVELIGQIAPPGTEPDTFDGQAYVSIVGFRFQGARLFGLPIPAHTRFVEINLRSYVRRRVDDQTRRGVVFIQEIAPRRAVSAAAKWLYNENYITRRMRSAIFIADTSPAPGDTFEYAWQTRASPQTFRQGPREDPSCSGAGRAQPAVKRGGTKRWNRLAARITAPLRAPDTGSFEQFLTDNYWGYIRGRDGRTREYYVRHAPWQVAPVDNVAWDCDVAATYDAPFVEHLSKPPASALAADGSAIQLFRGRCI
jgi:uncharacterized protein YqjF (DUF2071 family)